MRGISSQFWGEMEIAPWIIKALDTLPSLINRKKPNKLMLKNIRESSFWVIGPKDGHDKKLFLYTHNKGETGSSSGEISSIEIPKGKRCLMVQCNGYLYKLPYDKSASLLAKKLDMLIHGAYTDVALIHLNEILERLEK
jgi:hypothetical protein